MRWVRLVLLLAAAAPVTAGGAAYAGAAGAPETAAGREIGPVRPSPTTVGAVPPGAVSAAADALRTTTTTAPPPPPPPPPVRPAAAPVAAPPATCEDVVASITWPPGWHPRCEGPRGGLLGLTDPDGVTHIYVRAGEGAAKLRVVALHESGHAWDFARLDDAKITQWCASRGCDAAHFFSGGASGPGWNEPGGAEDWAAVWDACHGGTYHRSYLRLGPPSGAQCALQNQLTGYPG